MTHGLDLPTVAAGDIALGVAWFVLACLGAVIVVQQDPGLAVSIALSMFPLTSPMAMPVRWSSGMVPEWQLVVSMVLALGAALLVAWFGSRVYRRALVITGRRLQLGEVLRPSSSGPVG